MPPPHLTPAAIPSCPFEGVGPDPLVRFPQAAEMAPLPGDPNAWRVTESDDERVIESVHAYGLYPHFAARLEAGRIVETIDWRGEGILHQRYVWIGEQSFLVDRSVCADLECQLHYEYGEYEMAGRRLAADGRVLGFRSEIQEAQEVLSASGTIRRDGWRSRSTSRQSLEVESRDRTNTLCDVSGYLRTERAWGEWGSLGSFLFEKETWLPDACGRLVHWERREDDDDDGVVLRRVAWHYGEAGVDAILITGRRGDRPDLQDLYVVHRDSGGAVIAFDHYPSTIENVDYPFPEYTDLARWCPPLRELTADGPDPWQACQIPQRLPEARTCMVERCPGLCTGHK